MVRMTAATFCSGVGAPEVAGKDFFKFLYSCEYEKFPSEVLKLRFPDVPNLGDMTKVRESEIFRNNNPEIMIAGTPCQGFSISGLRGGLEDERSKLSLEFVRILKEKQPRWFLWENVPGVLSSGEGNDFKQLLEAFTESGYHCAWRILCASGFGVPQRRRRVFVVGYLGNWEPPFRVLFESESLRGYLGACRNAREGTTAGTRSGVKNESGRLYRKLSHSSYTESKEASTLCARDYKGPGDIIIPIDLATAPRASKRGNGFGIKDPGAPSYTLLTGLTCGVFTNGFPRAFTPLEYERLQGFPDHHTAINGESTPKGPRYKAMGNSMAVPVMKWIMDRIFIEDMRQKVEVLKCTQK